MRWFICVTCLIGATVCLRADPLLELNAATRTAYRTAQSELLTQSGPIIIVSGDDLILIHQGKREQVAYIPKGYHDRKAVSHVPLGIFVLLNPGGGDLEPLRKDQVQSMRTRIVKAVMHIEKLEIPEESRQRQLKLLQLCSTFLDQVANAGKVDPKALLAFVAATKPLSMELANEAGILQLNALHAQVSQWRRTLKPEEWKTARVINIGGQMPREQNLATQYFARLLHEKGEGQRIIYAEALWDEAKALNLLATHQIDGQIGEAFFGDATRMNRDLLADVAAEYIKQMKFHE